MKSLVKQTIRQLPFAEEFLIDHKFRIEEKLLQGTHVHRSSQPSIIHFSINKSATQYVKRVLRECGRENDLVTVDFPAYAFNKSSVPYFDRLASEEMRRYAHVFKEYGYFYSAFGGMIRGIPNFDNFRKLLVVRDPRDVLTSDYFSIANSHPPPRAEDKVGRFIERREWVRRVSIDEYVLERESALATRYREYSDGLRGLPNVHVTKYEDMVADFPRWLEGVLTFCELRIRHPTFRRLVDENRTSREQKEDVTKHRRQMYPGDYRRKLKAATIRRLNDDLKDVLFAYGYT